MHFAIILTETGQDNNRWVCFETANFPAFSLFALVWIKALLSSREALLSSLGLSLLLFNSAMLYLLTPATVNALEMRRFHVCGRTLWEKERKQRKKKNNATNNCLGILEKKGRGLCLENSLSFVFNKEQLQTDFLQTLATYWTDEKSCAYWLLHSFPWLLCFIPSWEVWPRHPLAPSSLPRAMLRASVQPQTATGHICQAALLSQEGWSRGRGREGD